MPNKKPQQSEEPAGDPVLVGRVDAMMSTELAKDTPPMPKAAKSKPNTKQTAAKPKSQKTAPKLPPKLLKSLETETSKPAKSEALAGPPIVIKLADEGETSPEPDAEPESKPEGELPEPEETDQGQPNDLLEDSDTNKAVDDIVAHESDTILAVNDALAARQQEDAQPGRPAGSRSRHKWLWFIGFVILVGTAVDAFIFLSK